MIFGSRLAINLSASTKNLVRKCFNLVVLTKIRKFPYIETGLRGFLHYKKGCPPGQPLTFTTISLIFEY